MESLIISLAVLTQYTIVTDRQTQTDSCHNTRHFNITQLKLFDMLSRVNNTRDK